jgi:hypothetical protein
MIINSTERYRLERFDKSSISFVRGKGDLGPFSSGKSDLLLIRFLLYNFLQNDKIPPGVSELREGVCVTLAGMRFPALTPIAG